MQPPLSIRLQASRSAVAALISLHGLALFALITARIGLPLTLLISASVVISCVVCLRRHVLPVSAITLRRDAELEIENRNGERIVTQIAMSSSIFHWLVALRLRDGKRMLSLVLLPDMMDVDAWRRLAVALRSLRTEIQAK